MIRGSGWKGSLAAAFKELINETPNKKELIDSYFRILGAGSEYVKALEEGFAQFFKNQAADTEAIKSYLTKFLFFELGMTADEKIIAKKY